MQTGSEQTAFETTSLPMIATGQKLFHAGAHLQAQTFKALMRYQIESLAFLKHRYEEDVKLVDELIASDQPKDAFDVVSNFVQNAASEYAAEAGKLASVGSKLATETAKFAHKEADDTIKSVASRTVA